MSIDTAKAKILKALQGMDIDCVDNAKMIRPEGLLLSFEGMAKDGFSSQEYIFGLYVSKKILNKKTESIYVQLDSINTKIVDEARISHFGDEIALKSIYPVGFDNGIIEYRCEIRIIEK
ncbi:MAG: hypothetical protein PHV62_08340 [Sulfuricurvum sp.]|nr:hypothetical protein [Sulfuricurvum sp.]